MPRDSVGVLRGYAAAQSRGTATINIRYTPVMRCPSAAGIILVCLFLFATNASAKETHIQPVRALSSDQYTILSSYQESADGTVEGAGAFLRIGYTSSVDLNGYVVIMNPDATYNPADMNSFTLPADPQGTAIVDLRTLSTWTPSSHLYYLSFLSSAVQTDTQFSEMTILPAGPLDIVSSAFMHLFSVEPYWVSSMHLLRGYTMLNTSFSLILGCILALIIVVLCIWKKSAAVPAVMLTLIAGLLFYSVRFTTDLGIHAVAHLQSWTTHRTFAQAGDVYNVADALKKNVSTNNQPAAVSVCFSSTDYYAKLLRYLVYPLPVTMSGQLLPATTHVVVTHDLNWSDDNGVLHCGSIDHPATLIESFPDGTALYSLTR